MGEIELKFDFDTESRGALFAPRQGFIYTIFTPEPCESSARAQTGYIGDSPMLLFFAILWGVPKNCITGLPDKSKFKYLFKHFYKLSLGDNGNTELAGFGELASRIVARYNVVGLFRH